VCTYFVMMCSIRLIGRVPPEYPNNGEGHHVYFMLMYSIRLIGRVGECSNGVIRHPVSHSRADGDEHLVFTFSLSAHFLLVGCLLKRDQDSVREVYGSINMLLAIGGEALENPTVKQLHDGIRFIRDQLARVIELAPATQLEPLQDWVQPTGGRKWPRNDYSQTSVAKKAKHWPSNRGGHHRDPRR
jgi:hypothetical protein